MPQGRPRDTNGDAGALDRPVSSAEVLAQRWLAFGHHWRERSEDEARAALRDLAAEARLLARSHPLWPTTLDQRQKVTAEADPGGRMDSSS